MSNMKIFLNGLLKENPVLVLMIGMCPSLAITTAAFNGIGMGLSTTFVLIGSNVVISLLRKIIPNEVRLPAYIVVIAGFVTIIGFLLARYFPDLNEVLGVYVALITVNCIILMRAETFASKNSVGKSVIDALGYGLGFTLALLIIGSIREIFGVGTWFGMQILPESVPPMSIFINPAGGFFVLGIVIAVVNRLVNGKKPAKVKECGECGGCEGGCADCSQGGAK